MSHDASFRTAWGDGEYRFAMPMGALRDLENKRNAGALEINMRFVSATCRVDDVIEIVRIGLEYGEKGNLTPVQINELVKRYVMERPLIENVEIAARILEAGLMGVPHDQPQSPKKDGSEKTAGGSPSPNSTAQPLSSDGTLEPLITSASGN